MQRPRFLAAQRAIAIIGLAVMALTLDVIGPNRHVVAALLLFVHLPIDLAIEYRAPRGQVDRLHIVHDLCAILVIVSLTPSMWVAALCMGTMIAVAASSTLGAFEYPPLAYGFLAGMTIVTVRHDAWDEASIPIAAVALAVGPVGGYAWWHRRRIGLAASRTEMLIESSSAMFFELDADDWTVLSLRGQVQPILGRTAAEFCAEPLTRHFHQSDHWIGRSFASDDGTAVTARYLHPDGEIRWLRVFARRADMHGQHVLAGVAIDVTALERSKQELRHRAEHDPLTGLRTRDVLLGALRAGLRADPDRMAVAIVDFDDFKWINDTLGHPAGDELLRRVGADLGALENDELKVCRLGGDEFGLLIEADDPRAAAERAARTVLAVVGALRTIERVDIRLAASVGIAAGWTGATSRDLLRDADIAMYEAKRTRSEIVVFTQRPASLTSAQLSTVARLTRTLEHEVQLWFQPIVDLATGRIVSVEGLARWDHPEHGILLPGSFLPTIERGGLAARLDWHAFSKATQFAAAAVAQGTPVAVAVNMTATGLRSDRLVPTLEALHSAGHPLQYLTIEISERDLHDDIHELKTRLSALRDFEVGLALDDYGTGFSSLIRLRDVPFTQVKIDRSFISDLVSDRTDQAIVRSTALLASELSLDVVAEGVEDLTTAALLSELGCTLAQGFAFAHPRPAAEILAQLREERDQRSPETSTPASTRSLMASPS
jgi:diguanylate cyclase (GGDEF)-like protein